MNYTLLASLSFFVGILVGLTGIGGTSLITPMLILVFQLIFAPQFQLPAPPKINLETLSGKSWAIAIGAILGCVVGLTSVSSGSMFALVLIAFFQLDAQKLVGTDLVQAAILLSFTSLGHLGLGTVDWSLVSAIWIGSIPGVLIGAKLCQLIPQRPLRSVLYMLLIMVSWKLVHFA
jgi:uncharacterized protein